MGSLIEEYRGYEIVSCRNHFHATVGGFSLIGADFDSVAQARKWIDKKVQEDMTICEWCGGYTDGSDHNPDCVAELVADVLDEFGNDDEPNTRTRDFRWATIMLRALRDRAGVPLPVKREGNK